MNERTKVKEFYTNPSDFLEDLNSIPVKKLEKQTDKDLIKKLKRWVKIYWTDDGEMNLYETQYKRIQQFKEFLNI